MKRENRQKGSAITIYLALLVAFFLLINNTLGFLLAQQASNTMISLIQSRMLDITNTAADMLDGDVLETVTPADKGTEGYEAIMDTLRCFQDNIALEYIYCIRTLDDGSLVFGLDPTVENPGEFNSPVTVTDALLSAAGGTAAVDTDPYEDDWGSFYSAYTPVFNSAGQVAGIVAVDFSREWYDAQVSTLMWTTIVSSAVSLVIGGGIVMVITSRTRKRIRTVHARLNELADNLDRFMAELENQAETPVRMQEKPAPHIRESIDSLGERVLSMQEELHTHISRLNEQAYIDALTGVRNKAAYLNIRKRLEFLIEEGGAAFSVAVLDMNGLKTINDLYGHELGDIALADAAGALISVFGKENIFRIGGDEFIVITKARSETGLLEGFARLDSKLEVINRSERPYRCPLSLSKGYAVYDPGTDHTYNEVFRRADQRMYDDKAAYYAKHGDRQRRRNLNLVQAG